jgi:hypothetical protein
MVKTKSTVTIGTVIGRVYVKTFKYYVLVQIQFESSVEFQKWSWETMIIERSREKPLKPIWSSCDENYVLFRRNLRKSFRDTRKLRITFETKRRDFWVNTFEEALIKIKSKSSFLGLKQANGNFRNPNGRFRWENLRELRY